MDKRQARAVQRDSRFRKIDDKFIRSGHCNIDCLGSLAVLFGGVGESHLLVGLRQRNGDLLGSCLLYTSLTACQKDEGLVSDGATSQTITVTIPQGTQTRASAADFGNGAKSDRYLLQIYHSGTTPAKYGDCLLYTSRYNTIR